jgi:hypothetical protein
MFFLIFSPLPTTLVQEIRDFTIVHLRHAVCLVDFNNLSEAERSLRHQTFLLGLTSECPKYLSLQAYVYLNLC